MATVFISLDEVIEIATSYCPDDDGTCEKAGTDLREMLDELEAIPPADVVEVVRCKDCVNAKKGEPGSLFHFCIRLNQITSNNFYCACGERRTE